MPISCFAWSLNVSLFCHLGKAESAESTHEVGSRIPGFQVKHDDRYQHQRAVTVPMTYPRRL